MRNFLCGILLVGIAGHGLAQEDTPYALRNYSPANGLPQSQVHALLEDSNGYLWIGTEGGGLARFDGREFKIYNTLSGLLSNIIDALHIDKKGNLWILHPRGLTRYDGITFKRFQGPGSRENHQNLRRIREMNDTLFVLSAAGTVAKIYEDSVYYWNRPLVKDKIALGLHQGPRGQLISVLTDGNIYVLDNEKRYFISAGPDRIDPKNRFNIFNYENDVWIIAGQQTFKINFGERILEKLSLPLEHWVLWYDKNEKIFWTRNRNTLFKETVQDAKVQKIDTVLKDADVFQVLPDSEGNCWIATNGRGLFKYFARDFTSYGTEDLRVTMAILVDDYRDKWIGSLSTGLWKISGGKLHSYNDKKGYQYSVAALAKGPDGTVWAGASNGLGRYDRASDKFTWLTEKDGLSSSAIMNITFDSSGGMWVGTQHGLNYFDGKKYRAFFSSDGLSGNSIWSTHFSKFHKTLYVGTEFGMDAIKGDKVSRVNIPGIENTMICTIKSYRDSLLLLGIGGLGVMIVDPSSSEMKTITTHDGLASDFIYFAAEDEQGVLWIGSEKGITRMRLSEKLEIVENLHYDDANGLIGMETNHNSFYFDGEDKYFGLIDGLYKFNYVDRKDKKSFNLHLTDVELFYGEDSLRSYCDSLTGFFKIPHQPLLPPDKNHITFYFNKVDKLYPKSVKFKYYVENFDKTWSHPSSMNLATYSNLPPGDYIFRVMATDNSGSWSDQQIAYAFTVLTPFYMRSSFIAGMIILLAGAITLVIYERVRQRVRKVIETERIRMREHENVRKEIARDFHDEMGNQLTRIINYISLMKLNGKSRNGQYDLYEKVEESAKYLYTGTRDFIWSIDPGNDELIKLFIHIRDFGEKLFEEKNICFRAFDEVKEHVKLPMGFSREANLIFKEAMTNSFKYSEAGNATLFLKQTEEGFEMGFEDDGIGFNVPETIELNGLKNIAVRAERIGAVLRIHSVKNEGTKIVLCFKLNKTPAYGTTL